MSLEMGENKLTSEIISLLEKSANESIDNFDVVVHDNDAAGYGYLAELVFVSLKNKATNENLHLIVKQAVKTASPTDMEVMDNTYFNEIYFYKNIWKVFDEFQRKFPKTKLFDKIPKFYGSMGEYDNQKFVLENLKYAGYLMFPRSECFNESQLEFILTSYGQFHGISAAFREHNPEEYKKLMNPLRNSSENLLNMGIMKAFISISMNQLISMVKDEKVKNKLERYRKEAPKIAIDSLKYNGPNPVFNHGDCWSNNFMITYDNYEQISDIRLIDFQLCRIGSVVSDLSYLIYSGVSKNILDRLDYYLKIYHDSFSNTLRNFDLVPSQIFTFEDLKKEWKDHCTFGFLMGQAIWNTKLAKTFEKRSLVELNTDFKNIKKESNPEGFDEDKYKPNKEKLQEVLLDLVQHVCDNNYV